MATFTHHILSASTDGQPVAVAATATPGTTLHTAHATALDEITLVVSNIHTAAVELTLEVGGVTTADQQKFTLAAKESRELPRIRLTNSKVLKAFADSANKVNVTGRITRITS